MSALDTAKEIGRMAATATLSKDVIDLFEKKVGLLTEQVAALETENANLKKKVGDLEKELSGLRPKEGRLEDGAEKILRFVFDEEIEDVGFVEVMAPALHMQKGVIKYHCDSLYEAEMLGMVGVQEYGLLPKGRAYVVKYLLDG